MGFRKFGRACESVELKIEKGKLPKGKNYPLKTTFLAEILKNDGLEIETSLSYSPGLGYIFFDASFHPPGGDFNYERLFVRVGAIPSYNRISAIRFMEEEVIPDFLKWIKGLLSLPPGSPIRREIQRFNKGLGLFQDP